MEHIKGIFQNFQKEEVYVTPRVHSSVEAGEALDAVTVWVENGRKLTEQNHHEVAILCYEKVLEFDPFNTAAWNGKGLNLTHLGDFSEAFRCFDRAIELDPKYALAWINKGFTLNCLGHFDEALYCFDRALEFAPEYPVAWYYKGTSLDSLDRFEEAITCYDKALETCPLDANLWSSRGVSLNNLDRYEEAIHCLNKAVELNPNDPESWFNKACAEEELGLDPVRSFQRFLALATDEYRAQIEHARLRLGELTETTFAEAMNTVVLTCFHIAKGSSPILLVKRDENDISWEFLCGPAPHQSKEILLVTLRKMIVFDPTIEEVSDLPVDHSAIRDAIGKAWVIQPSESWEEG